MSEPLAPFQAHSKTSREAAIAIHDDKLPILERVFQFMENRGFRGATDEEIHLVMNLNPSTARPRRRELEKMGRVKDSGRSRRTKSGRNAVIWVVVPPGEEVEVQERSREKVNVEVVLAKAVVLAERLSLALEFLETNAKCEDDRELAAKVQRQVVEKEKANGSQ